MSLIVGKLVLQGHSNVALWIVLWVWYDTGGQLVIRGRPVGFEPLALVMRLK